MKILAIIISVFIFCSCNPQKRIAGNYNYKSECLGVELDGSQTLKAWGSGRNRFDATEQAKKNAVRDVLFNGIREGKQECDAKPVVLEINAQEKHEEYFNKFFSDNGEYKNYVSLKDERIEQKVLRDRKGARNGVTQGLVVRVLRSELKQKMKQDGIIK
jgi:hypothetical protein